jgi:WD40 repeat protein
MSLALHRLVLSKGQTPIHSGSIQGGNVNGPLVAILGGHRQPVASAQLSFDGTQIVTTFWDHTARLWRLESSKALDQLPEQPLVGGVALNADSGGIEFDRDHKKSLTFAGKTA